MSREYFRKKYCICSPRGIVQKEPIWICSCTASLYKVEVLKAFEKRVVQRIVNLNISDILDNLRVDERRLRELERLNPGVLGKEVVDVVKAQRLLREKETVSLRAPNITALSPTRAPPAKVRLIVEGEMSTSEKIELTALSSEASAALENALKSFDITVITAHLRDLQDLYKYQGFDVQHIRRVFMHWFGRLPSNLTIHFTQSKPLGVSTNENLTNCLNILAFLFNYRGNNTKNILDGLSPTIRANMEKLFTGLHIKDKVVEKRGDKATKSRDTLTLSRIAAAFPTFAMRIAAEEGYDRRVIDMTDVGISQDIGVNRALCHPLAGSMLTAAQKKAGYAMVTYVVALKLNAVIGPKGVKTDAGTVWTYHKAVLNSNAAPENHKITFWGHYPQLAPVDKEAMINKMLEFGASEQVVGEVQSFV